MVKKLILLILAMLLVAFALHASIKKATGVAVGKHGDVIVEVTFDGNKIKDISVLKQKENKILAKHVFTDLKDDIVKYNSVAIDGISGATISSDALIAAVINAADTVGIKLNKTHVVKAAKKLTIAKNQTYDVVVIGAGGAGFAAAITAKNEGANVIILEKMPSVGGNSAISGAEMNAANNWVERGLGILDDTSQRHFDDTMKGGDYKGDQAVVRVMTDNALDAAEWMRDYVKVPYIPDFAFQFGGHTRRRAVVPEGHTGAVVISSFEPLAEKLGITIITDMKATELIKNSDGRVVGVKAVNGNDTYTFNATKAVVIATGGFGSSMEMRKKYNPYYDEKFLTTDLPGTTGDGMVMAEKAGAQLINMEYIQTYPICDPISGAIELVADARFDGAILVNKNGERFVEELERRDVISKAILAQPGKISYVLWNGTAEERGKYTTVHADEYEAFTKTGIMFEAPTLKELAQKAGINYENLLETVKKANSYAKTGKDLDFNNRVGIISLEKGPYYAIAGVPAVHHTMGGVRIDTRARALAADGTPIPGLYAAGEVTGSVHGTNRLGGNAYTDIIVYGRIAGKEAANLK